MPCFAAQWHGRSLREVKTPKGHARYAGVLHWMRAAKHGQVPWHVFKYLDRETQGQVVAFYEADTKLDYLEQKEAIKEAKRKARVGGKSRV